METKEFVHKTGSEIRQLIKKMPIEQLDVLIDEINNMEDVEIDEEKVKRLSRAAWLAYQERNAR